MARRKRREFKEEFKLQMVSLFQNGKVRSEIIREYDLTPSSFNLWVKQYGQSGSFKRADNLTEDQKLLKKLEAENKDLKMENDILKQAALIMGRKSK